MNSLQRFLLGMIGALALFAGTAAHAEEVYFYHTDAAGTPLAMSDSSGQRVWEADYKPFGEEYTVSGTSENDKRFVGKEKDDETGLNYFGARYLSAGTGRFLAPDPVRAVGAPSGQINQMILANPQRINVYGYALNNPYSFVDPDGNFAQVLYLGVPILIAMSCYAVLPPEYKNQLVHSANVALNHIRNRFYDFNEKNSSQPIGNSGELPNQGTVTGGVEGAPPVDAGKQGKHVPGHNNEVEGKSKWQEGENGVKETQEAWVNGTPVRPDGSVRVGKGESGRNIRVHQDSKGRLHGYPVSK